MFNIASFFMVYKLGWQDSNLRMPAPKAGAVPLGYTPLSPIWFKYIITNILNNQDRFERKEIKLSLLRGLVFILKMFKSIFSAYFCFIFIASFSVQINAKFLL